MDKEKFIKIMGNNEDSVIRIYDLIEESKNGKYVISKEFFTPNIWKKIQNMNILNENEGFLDLLSGERRLFSSKKYNFPSNIVLVKIRNTYKKRELSHRDYMGSLMNLGIEREKFSDLIVKDDSCHFLTFKNLANHIKDNLDKAAHNALELDIIEDLSFENLEGLEMQYTDMIIQIASRRLDVIVSEITRKSRSESEKLIKQGEVQINYEKILDRAKEVQLSDIITIRGFGKYIFNESLGFTKKENERIKIKKYV